jgi:hypothetical protein
MLATHLPIPRVATADEPAAHEPRQALAEVLFQEARDLVERGELDLACPKFAESQRIDPATGTLLNLAACHESTGKFASSWSEFNQALIAAQRDDREDRVRFAKDHIHELEGRLAHVTIRVAAPNATAPLDIRLDNVPVGQAAWGTALPIDPGKHRIESRAPGSTPWFREIVVNSDVREVIVEVPSANDMVSPPTSFNATARKQRTFALAVGAVGIVTGSVFGLYAFSHWHDAENACPTGKGCSRAAIDARSSANASAIGADIAFGIGIAGLAVATYVWATKPRSTATSTSSVDIRAVPVVGREAMGMGMEGRF